MCFIQNQYKGNHRGGWPKAATFVLTLNREDALAPNTAHVLRLNTKICPVFTKLPGIPMAAQVFLWLSRWPCPASKLPGIPIAAQVFLGGLARIPEKKFCPRQRSCLGQVASSKKVGFLRKSSAPGSEAARDKWLLQKKSRPGPATITYHAANTQPTRGQQTANTHPGQP